MSEPLHRIVLIEHYIDVKNSLEIQPYGWIYKIEFPNGKVYIGQTTCLEDRKTTHISCANNDNKRFLVYKALRKYNIIETFELVVIDTADNEEELSEKEIAYIHFYNSHHVKGYGYNMTFGGEGTNGYVRTEEDRTKMSISQKKRYENPEERQKNGERVRRYFEDPEAKKKLSISQKKRLENPEVRQKISERSKKQFEVPGAKQRMSETKKKYHEEHPESKQQMSEIKKKYHEEHPEAGENHSKIMKKRFVEHPELGKEHGKRMKKHYEEHPEKKQKMSEKGKKRFENQGEREKILDTKGQNKPFDVYKKKDGELIGTFTYQFQARDYLKKEYNKKDIDISAVLGGRQTSSKGFKFKYI